MLKFFSFYTPIYTDSKHLWIYSLKGSYNITFEFKDISFTRIYKKSEIDKISDYEVVFKLREAFTDFYIIAKMLLDLDDLGEGNDDDKAYKAIIQFYETAIAAKSIVYTHQAFYYYRVSNPNSSSNHF